MHSFYLCQRLNQDLSPYCNLQYFLLKHSVNKANSKGFIYFNYYITLLPKGIFYNNSCMQISPSYVQCCTYRYVICNNVLCANIVPMMLCTVDRGFSTYAISPNLYLRFKFTFNIKKDRNVYRRMCVHICSCQNLCLY